MFQVFVCDAAGELHDLGSVKMGFAGQTIEQSTYRSIEWPVDRLPSNYFSLGNDVEYYEKIRNNFSREFLELYCTAMRDCVYDTRLIDEFSNEDVFKVSLMRSTSVSAVQGQYKRVLDGGSVLTEFDFSYIVEQSEDFGGYELGFKVVPASKPPTNIHAVIGRNGVGKTSFLNDIVRCSLALSGVRGKMMARTWFQAQPIGSSYFSGVISVSFSAFDPFTPPEDEPEPTEGPFYRYIGIKNLKDVEGKTLKSTKELQDELVSSIGYVLGEAGLAERWRDAIGTLESDANFREIDLQRFARDRDHLKDETVRKLVEKLSSGHAIVLLTMTKLVSFVQEKTLVLIDEPESHLHPPLLSAFTRSLSNLLYNRNGVAIIATHSPVVIQEIPSICTWKLVRARNQVGVSRPEIETFGENVGTLTREIFGLEVAKSGFHTMLEEEVAAGKSFDQIIEEYDGAIGFEGQALVRALIAERGRR